MPKDREFVVHPRRPLFCREIQQLVTLDAATGRVSCQFFCGNQMCERTGNRCEQAAIVEPERAGGRRELLE